MNEAAASKVELLSAIQVAWSNLQAALQGMSEKQLTNLRDAAGWSVKDHLIHVTSWERSVVFFLQGKPRSAGLGVEATLFREASEDEINAVIQRQRKDMPLPQALAELREVHEQLLARVRVLSDADLQEPYAHFLPDEADGDTRTAIRLILSNTLEHFADHQGWIETLVFSSSSSST